jgi:hypothetical protein
LAELDNIDKHRLLIPMVTIASLHRVDVEDEAGNRIYSGFASVLQGRVQDIATGVNKPKIKHKGYAGIDVRFGESTPLLGKPVFETIGEFPEIVSKAIDAFELFCLGTIADPNTVER